MPQKPASVKADQIDFGSGALGLLMKLSFGDENCVLLLCAYVEDFCKSGHILYCSCSNNDMLGILISI